MNDTQPTEKFDSWCLVELFGHQKIVGKVTESSLAGGAFLRVDVPETNGEQAFTRFFSPGAVYSINPVSEAVARGLLIQHRNEPVSRFDLPQLADKLPDPAHQDYCSKCRELETNCTCDRAEDVL